MELADCVLVRTFISPRVCSLQAPQVGPSILPARQDPAAGPLCPDLAALPAALATQALTGGPSTPDPAWATGRPVSQELALAEALTPAAAPADSAATSTYSVYDSPKHLLHGVLHYNGFGHLARVNGVPPLLSESPLPSLPYSCSPHSRTPTKPQPLSDGRKCTQV